MRRKGSSIGYNGFGFLSYYVVNSTRVYNHFVFRSVHLE